MCVCVLGVGAGRGVVMLKSILRSHKLHDDFDFDKVSFPFLDGDGPRAPSYGVYIS